MSRDSIAGILFVCALAWHATSMVFAEGLNPGTDLILVGVYEGDRHKYGKVTVFVAPQSRPVALLLTAYESVDWEIELEPGALLERVYLSGYHVQKVSGLHPAIPVESMSYDQRSRHYFYGSDERSCSRAIDKASELFGKRPKEFLCQYKGMAFVVDRDGVRALPVSQ